MFFGRDPFGIKPFYYRIGKDGISFSSEFKAFMFDPEMKEYAIDESALQSFFTFQYVTEPDTVSPDIKILPAGHYAVIDENLTLSPVEYYDARFTPQKGISFDEKEKKYLIFSPVSPTKDKTRLDAKIGAKANIT
jgi:asparagine synthase (glutamine-hydrolysing)